MKIRLCLCLLLSAAAAWPVRAEDPAPPPDVALSRLTDEMMMDAFTFQPLNGVGMGLHQFDGKFVDFRRASIDAEIRRIRDFQARLAAIEPAKLSAAGAFDAKLLRMWIENNLLQLTEMGVFDRNPMTYAGALDVNAYLKRDFAPLPDRLRSIIATERQAPTLYAAARENLAAVLPKPFVELGIDIAKGGADFLTHDLVEAVRGVQDPALQAEFKAVNDKAAAEESAFADWLTKERLPKASEGGYAIGEANYRKMLAASEAIDLPPAKLLEIGMAALRHEQENFAAAAAIIEPGKPPIEVFKAIQHDHPTAESLLPEIRSHLEAIRSFMIDRNIIDIPSEVRATVAETPQYLRAGSFASSDNPGPFEVLGAQAYYYVTPVEASWTDKQKDEWLTSFNRYTSDIVSVHEVYPGHYVQALRMNASPLSKVQRVCSSYAFIEGWAHYCEQMAVDEGYGRRVSGDARDLQGAKYRLAQSDEALLRICRLCMSIKLHTQGLSVDEAQKFFEQNCYYEAKPARQEALRGTFDPGYLFYTVGKLELLKLRRDYQAQEGAAYTLKRFNDAVTDHGWPPVRLLREILLKDPSKAGDIL